jgi:hypothetical protein
MHIVVVVIQYVVMMAVLEQQVMENYEILKK